MDEHQLDRLTAAYKRGDLTADEFAALVGRSQESPQSRPTGSAHAQTVAVAVAVVGSVMMVAGTALPWATVLGVSVTGWSAQLPFQVLAIALGGLVSLSSLFKVRWTRLASIVAGSIGFCIGGYYFFKLLQGAKGEVFGQSFRVSISPGIGLWAILLGGIACVSANTWLLLQSTRSGSKLTTRDVVLAATLTVCVFGMVPLSTLVVVPVPNLRNGGSARAVQGTLRDAGLTFDDDDFIIHPYCRNGSAGHWAQRPKPGAFVLRGTKVDVGRAC